MAVEAELQRLALARAGDVADAVDAVDEMKSLIQLISGTLLPPRVKAHQSPDWFELHREDLRRLIRAKRAARLSLIRVPKKFRVKSEQMVVWRKSRWAVTAACRRYKSEFWESLSTSLNFMFERNDMNSFFATVKRTYGVAKKGSSPGSGGLLNVGGDLMYTTPAQVLARWREHFSALLNQEGQVDHGRIEQEFLPQQRENGHLLEGSVYAPRAPASD